ncbi:unnamed protein product [Adineta steineri]|uniref:Uncharacterized protein n=1 Tax=Adineta steineri TaxID=433720 RepID=A0A813Z4T7_9BILA|nr:unnamed protein product [Adineta steineri]CAF0893432.1 unnamed protein product [Adineta steineri]
MDFQLCTSDSDLDLRKYLYTAHCLVTESKQPAMNENSKIISKADLTTHLLDLMKLLPKKRYHLDASKIKTSNPHEHSLEQQIYYKEITDAYVGSEERKTSSMYFFITETIAILSSKTDLHRFLSWIVVFIYEDVNKYISPVYRASRSTPDDLGHFKEEFGIFYGQCLYTQVTQLHQQSRSTTKSIQVSEYNIY